MDVTEAIETRRSVGRVKQEPVAPEDLERILESAVHAPNHRITEPWRFHVFVGKGRGELARVRAEIARRTAAEDGEDEELAKGRISRERKKAFRSPVVIAVVSVAGRDEVETLENYAACCCAVQNMQLTAHALGLASIWRTGPSAYHPLMREFLGLERDGDTPVAFLYLGSPDLPVTRRRRRPVREFTVWHEG
ncbi:Nitroreductase [Rubrobacter radiotolerans]|uniref:Putative NAD(P)H nitroreductase n=1 Tax=Rubrobacter radiotolerans TaxID=42256 RepID=A0A023X283_RUBRA|nr:nitroreductase [Rubrobacter radiotolerans]AHY46547.1 Nitroreductase [Rubrobacter radiotolerans]MDX5893955.1 nitroreductase [Rubrobacter radiotolerans]SMC04850.1 Nitroreductase [Rubrobacter radiotolerans DSM 5868]